MIRLLKGIIIPEKIGSYYLVPKRVLGFDISKTEIQVTKLFFNGQKIRIEGFYEEKLETDTTIAYAKRVSNAIKKIIDRIGGYDEIRASLSSGVAIFKELTLPFIDHDKIAMVLNYEIEPYLPFSLHEAVIDFMITKTDIEQQTAKVLVAAVKKDQLVEFLAYFHNADIDPDVITIDLFDLYGLYKKIPSYAQLTGSVALIDIGFTVTRIAFIIHGQLTLVRTIPKGLSDWAKKLAPLLSISPKEALESIIRFGVEKNNDQRYNQSIIKTLSPFWQQIQFTLSSFLEQTKSETLDTMLLLGIGAEVENLCSLVTGQLQTTCALFDVNKLLQDPNISTKGNKRIPRANIMSLATALITSIMQDFNLRQAEFRIVKTPVFIKQLITTSLLLVLIMMALITHSFWQTRRLHSVETAYKNEVIKVLRNKDLSEGKKGLKKAIEDAEEKVETAEEIWFAFSGQTRFSFLKYLQELSSAVDRESIGLKLTKLVINQKDNTLGLEGEVRDFKALKIFERELNESNMFVSVPGIPDIKFNITLNLKANGEQE